MDLEQLMMTDFVLLLAEWPVAKGRELVDALRPSHVIVQRREGSNTYYYLRTFNEAWWLLQTKDEITVRQALDLHEWDATPALEATTNADVVPDFCVVLSEGEVDGFYAANIPPDSVTRSGEPRRGDGPPQGEPEPATATQSLDAQFPDSVPIGETASLVVQLWRVTQGASQPRPGLAIPLQPGAQLDILVQARRGFVIEGPAERTLTVSEQEETLPIQFKLRAKELGSGQIRVLAFHNGVALGALTLTPTVMESDAGLQTDQRNTHIAPLAAVSIQVPDLSLLIEETTVNNSRGFCMRISAADPAVNLNLAKFGPILFETEPGPHFDAFYSDIENYPLNDPNAREIAVQQLINKGTYLFEHLVPIEARQKLWELKDQIKTVLVQSEEPWIPWELCKLVGEEQGEVVEGPFFCEAFTLTRWIPGPGLKPALRLSNIGLVVPNDSGLPFAVDERNFLLSLQAEGRQVTSVPARFNELQKMLASGQYDAWHFSGHGAYRNPDPNRSVMVLENNEEFSPINITGKVRNLGKPRPLVFLNACQIGRGGKTLTGVGGWARQFLLAGAGAFIGAYWSVYDKPAYQFAEAIYQRLIAGKSIGEATKEARLSIKDKGDPTWLAYTVFADPFARVQPGAPQS